MTQPTQPADPPAEGAAPDTNRTGETPNGIPGAAGDGEPKGGPTSDRHKTETAPNR